MKPGEWSGWTPAASRPSIACERLNATRLGSRIKNRHSGSKPRIVAAFFRRIETATDYSVAPDRGYRFNILLKAESPGQEVCESRN